MVRVFVSTFYVKLKKNMFDEFLYILKHLVIINGDLYKLNGGKLCMIFYIIYNE